MQSLIIGSYDKQIIQSAQLAASKSNSQIYLVGGAVRSFMLNQAIDDYDFVCFGNTAATAAHLAQQYNSRVIVLNDRSNVLRVPLPKGHADISSGRQDLLTDAKKRDFSLNAIYLQLDKDSRPMLSDPLNARADLQAKTLKAISDDIFDEDPLRLLRAFRLSAEFDLYIDKDTLRLIEKNIWLLSKAAPERSHEEWGRICRTNSFKIFEQMAKTGVLNVFFPLLKDAIDIKQSPEHYWPVFEHSIATGRAIDYILGNVHWPYLPDNEKNVFMDEKIKNELTTQIVALKTAAILHDIGKPTCRTQDIDSNRIRFSNHPLAGEKICRQMLPTMRFTKKESAQICALVRDHMRPTQLASQGQMPSVKAVFRFFRDNPYAISALYLSLADHLATCGPHINIEEWKQHNDLVKFIILSARTQEKQLQESRPISGYEIINYLHLPPSPLIAFALAEAHAAQAEGVERNEALRRAQAALKYQLRKMGLYNQKEN